MAAVDLGSNSFHMIVGELRHGQLTIIDRIKETVRLAEGLSDTGQLSVEARSRALRCLSIFGQRLRDMHAGNVRAAGTSTIRRAHEDKGFMAEAEAALGHPIEIISGIEEARLIYNGVTHSLPMNEGLRLVLDIGGGSTELILGQGSKPIALESLHLGCVRMTERFFPDGRLTPEAFEAARVAARLELRPVKAFFRDAAKVEAIGTSGTIISVETVASALGIVERDISPETVEKLIERVIKLGSIGNLKLEALTERRAQVWPGGLSILVELMRALRISTLTVSDGALREGLLYDLIGRLTHEDARERTVRAMAARYNVDPAQAERVGRSACMLLDQCAETWGLSEQLARHSLVWAARLHEIGLDISHDGYQRHGAYIAANADMPGFPRAEQRFLAFLIASQRYGVAMRLNKDLPGSWRQSALRVAILFRLAVLLNRSRNQAEIPPIGLEVTDDALELKFDSEWLAVNPLTVADLERETSYLRAVGYELIFN
jgi:exopolyphosphatase/guanosine-5'-triphosphate,3'-diphosphate pyrophosphatase